MTLSEIACMLMLVHSWYSALCCGDHDCHPIACSQLSYHDDYIYYGPDRVRPFAAQDSPDGRCHVCVNANRYIPDRIACVFVPRVST